MPDRSAAIRIVVVMGVSGSGKTEVGSTLARSMGWRFVDADEFHTAANKEKMHRGIGLTDADRAPWLAHLRALNSDAVTSGERTVLACSALKQAYRDALVPNDAPDGAVKFVFLDVPVEVLRQRLESRQHHFAPPELLDSQLATLEKPADALWVDGSQSVDRVVNAIRIELGI